MSEHARGIVQNNLPSGSEWFSRPRRLNAAPLVSVCIVNWNCCALLNGCLRSLLEQAQGASLEVIVVDNGSSDGAADMVAERFPGVVLLRNDHNIGFARANNQAARRARGHYLFFLNNDTIVPAHTLGKLVAYLNEHPETLVVGPRLCDGSGNVQMSYRRRPTIATFLHRTLLLRWAGLFRKNYRAYRREDPEQGAEPRAVDVLMGAALLWRRSEFTRLGAWDEAFTFGGEDLELCFRAKRMAGWCTCLPWRSPTLAGPARGRTSPLQPRR